MLFYGGYFDIVKIGFGLESRFYDVCNDVIVLELSMRMLIYYRLNGRETSVGSLLSNSKANNREIKNFLIVNEGLSIPRVYIPVIIKLVAVDY